MIRNTNNIFIVFVLLILSLSQLLAFENETTSYKSKVLYSKYTNYPKVVFTKQRFNVSLELSIFLPDDQFFKIATNIGDGENIELLEKDLIWYMNENNKYETTLLFKAQEENFVFPDIRVTVLSRDGNIFDSEIVIKPKIDFRQIAINQEQYSNIIASELEIKSVKSRQYSNEEIMVLLEIDGIDGNLEEFFLSKYKNQGIKDIEIKDNKQKIFYFVMVPIFEKELNFEYYNPNESQFVKVQVPIDVKEELVSTQTDLNPYENDFDFYKRIAFIIFILLLLMLYLFKSKKIFLFLALVCMVYLIILILPNKTLLLKANEKVYILPTQNSTIFKILRNNEEVEVLGTNGTQEYKKVLFKNNQIGWIKND